MIAGFVLARANSKGLKDKNIAEFRGKSLLEIAINQSRACSMIDETFICTDSARYEEIAISSGAKSFGLRPPHLSDDTSKTIDVLLHHINNGHLSGFTHIALIQVTSPVRTIALINECIQKSLEIGQSSVTVSPIDEPHPMKALSIENQGLKPYIDGASVETPRQLFKTAYCLTGAVYVASITNIKIRKSMFSVSTIPIIQKSFINIDSQSVLAYLEFLDCRSEIEIDI